MTLIFFSPIFFSLILTCYAKPCNVGLFAGMAPEASPLRPSKTRAKPWPTSLHGRASSVASHADGSL
jgi:hypothetical protein